MKRNFARRALGLLSVLALFFLVLAPVPALAQVNAKPAVIQASHHDISPPLREMAAHDLSPSLTGQHVVRLGSGPALPGSDAPIGEDKALQRNILPLVGTVPGLNFDGVNSLDSVAPPDTNGSVGNTQYVQTTNFHYAIYDKTSGNLLLGPASLHTIWSGFGGNCGNGSDGGDPVVVYDKAANQWVISQLAGGYGSWCMAVSQTSDATGSYYRYEFPSGGNLDDYPKLGVWPDAYYRSTNTFGAGAANACAFDRLSMLTGGAANEICFQQNLPVFSLLPSDLDGATAPPSGEPNFFIELLDTSDLGLFKFHVDFSNPANSTFTGPTSIPVNSYTEACGNSACIPQQGTGQQLEGLGDRLMFRLAYRNFGDHEALVVNHSVVAGSSVGSRWYEIRDPNGSPAVFQQGTWVPDSSYRWMGSIGMDKNGDIALGYSVSSSNMFPSIRYTGRVPSDPSGQMESENSILEGQFFQSGLYRWGDYSDMSIDPIDDCTFFYTNQYQPANGGFNWTTRIASFKFIGCGSTTPDFYLTANPGSQTISPGGNTNYSVTVNPINGYSNTVGLSLSGCPSGATCSISPNSVGPPYNPSTLSVTTNTGIALGTYTITITGSDGTLTHSTTVTLVVTPPPDFSITAAPSSRSVKRGFSAPYTATVTALNGFNGVVTFSVTGLPANTTGTFSPASVTGHGTTTLLVVTTKKTPLGTYTLNITGTSGSLSHSATVSLKVTRK
jgi:hypothetical protein